MCVSLEISIAIVQKVENGIPRQEREVAALKLRNGHRLASFVLRSVNLLARKTPIRPKTAILETSIGRSRNGTTRFIYSSHWTVVPTNYRRRAFGLKMASKSGLSYRRL